MRIRFIPCAVALVIGVSHCFPLQPVAADRISPAGISGALVLANSGAAEAARRKLVELAGGEYATVAVLAAEPREQPLDEPARSRMAAPWLALGLAECVIIPVSGNGHPEGESRAKLKACSGVWIEPGAEVAALEFELRAVRERNGVVGGAGHSTAVFGQEQLPGESSPGPSLGWLPGTLVDATPGNSARREQLLKSLANHAGFVGVELGNGAALVIQGREMSVVGEGRVTILLAATATRPFRAVELSARAPGDYTEFRRAARARSEPVLEPAKEPRPPEVPKGSLVIVGGGYMPAEVTRRFIELAGGPEAPIVVLPTANPDPLPSFGEGRFFERAGAKHVASLPARELSQVEKAENLQVLKQARGIWFGGGRQWRFVDAYENTQALELMRDVLRRGGVIGGSSAGATIQGEYLCRGSPLGPQIMMCEGYEQGFAFLPGVAIDQHFTQRKRFPDMSACMKAFPQFLGLGLDEATALVVQGPTAEVLGPGAVHFYNTRAGAAAEYESLRSGDRYHLVERRKLPPAEKPR